MPIPVGNYTPASISFRDAGNQRASFRIYGTLITAANLVAKTALWVTLVEAAEAITLGAPVKTSYGIETLLLNSQPTNGAYVGTALLIQALNETTGVTYPYRLPTLDPTIPAYIINKNVKDAIELDTPSTISDFVAAFNAFAIDPFAPGDGLVVAGLKVVRGPKR